MKKYKINTEGMNLLEWIVVKITSPTIYRIGYFNGKRQAKKELKGKR